MRRLWHDIHATVPVGGAPEDSLGGASVPLSGVLAGVRTLQRAKVAHQEAHGREALQVPPVHSDGDCVQSVAAFEEAHVIDSWPEQAVLVFGLQRVLQDKGGAPDAHAGLREVQGTN